MKIFSSPRSLVIIQCYRPHSRFPINIECVSRFVTELRKLSKDCESEEALEENLKNKLVCTVNNHIIQNSLLGGEACLQKPLK